jgi:regulation of enolase protein 1 (concanavalin A-like superfamily)
MFPTDGSKLRMVHLVAEVFEHPQYNTFTPGISGIVYEPVRRTRDIGFQDNISSIRLYRGPAFASAPNFKMVCYEDANFRGRRLVLSPGFYGHLDLVSHGSFGDRISSIDFAPAPATSGPDYGTIPLIVDVYRGVNFRGRRATVLRDISNTADIAMQDVISSVRVRRGPNFPPRGCKVIFYEHIDFEGQALPVELSPVEYYKELPNLHTQPRFFGDIISSIKIESWASGTGGVFTEVAYSDEFDSLRPEWRWVDPKGDCRYSFGAHQRGGILTTSISESWLEIQTPPGHDLWWGSGGGGGDMSGPRMLQGISGDFSIQVKMTCSEQQKEHGGILVWKSENLFLRHEKTSDLHAFRGDVRFEKHIYRRSGLIGRGTGHRGKRFHYLRLDRTGHEFSAYCSTDGIQWQTCGVDFIVMQDPIEVGVHALCPGPIPPTTTRFDYFRILRRPRFAEGSRSSLIP